MKNFIAFIPAVLLVFSCTQPVERSTEYGNISGVVYDNNVGEPISVAQVQLSPGGKSTVTGTDGSFNFTNIEAGDYTVNVTKKGYNDASNVVTVLTGTTSECNLTMERIPAYVTADKTELDFGDNQSFTTLSFNIVNSSYENLSWHIEYDKSTTSFIAEITPSQGETQYGKTSAIVVRINRDNLNQGENISTIVIVSDNGDGSSEVRIKAYGQEKRKPSLNVLEATDIKASSAILNGSIVDSGIPPYMERGFVLSDSEMPTQETALVKLTATVTDENDFSVRADGLTLGRIYYVRAYAINSLGITYSSNQVKFTTVAVLPVVKTLAVSGEDKGTNTAVLRGTVEYEGDPAYTERGFVYSIVYENPTVEEEKVVVSGTGLGDFEKRVQFDSSSEKINVRAYAINDRGVAYGETVGIFKHEYYVDKSIGLGVQNEDIGYGYWNDMNSMCRNSNVAGLSDWRLPTKDELFKLYNKKEEIGGFNITYSSNNRHRYWSSTQGSTNYYYYVEFDDGKSGSIYFNNGIYSARCVRTL